jgi:catechol 2,3-dioxygenase-like lactoylglutathione lyase family enzyme
MKLSPMIRTALFVADLDRSTAFYREVLGLDNVFWEGELEGESLERLLSVPTGTRCRARILQSGDTSVGMVGLFELDTPPVVDQTIVTEARPGAACLVFYCSDLDEVTARLRAGEHRIVCAPLPLVHEGRTKQREMTFADPDGVMINLIEWDPDATDKPELS